MKTEWLSRRYIHQQAKKSPKAALECSRLHWLQLAMADKDDLLKYFNEQWTWADTCSLCIRYRACEDECPLFKIKEHCDECCSSFYVAQQNVFCLMRNNSAAAFDAWQLAAWRMYAALMRCKP